MQKRQYKSKERRLHPEVVERERDSVNGVETNAKVRDASREHIDIVARQPVERCDNRLRILSKNTRKQHFMSTQRRKKQKKATHPAPARFLTSLLTAALTAA